MTMRSQLFGCLGAALLMGCALAPSARASMYYYAATPAAAPIPYVSGSVYPSQGVPGGPPGSVFTPLQPQVLYCSPPVSSDLSVKPAAMGAYVTTPQAGGLISIGVYALNTNQDATGLPLGTVFDLSAAARGGVSGTATFANPLYANVKVRFCMVAASNPNPNAGQQGQQPFFVPDVGGTSLSSTPVAPRGTSYNDPAINGTSIALNRKTTVTYTASGQSTALPDLTSATWSDSTQITDTAAPLAYFTAP